MASDLAQRPSLSSFLRSLLRSLPKAGALAALALTTLPWPGGALDGDGLTPDSAGGFQASTYYRVARPDPRLCPAPYCGGFFVERVNHRRLICADGTRQKECHAAIVDFSALGLSADEEGKLYGEFGQKRVLARGSLVLRDVHGLEVPTLVVVDAWRGVTGTQRRFGRYLGIQSSGIVCITFPCPSYLSYALNTRRVGRLHSVDLTHAGATDEQIAAGIEALHGPDGLIGFGNLHRIKGPAGRGLEFRANEFYTKVASGGPRACGGFTDPPNPPCGRNEFCELPAGTCQIADLPGTCQEVPEACPDVWDPVCGCDGVTYGNDCDRQTARVALDHPGACDGGQQCGPAICADGLTCCNPVMGICAPPGTVCTQ